MRDETGRDTAAGRLEAAARRIEAEMNGMNEDWRLVAADQRTALLRRIAPVAPHVVRLLCPDYGRFGTAG